MTWRRTLRGQLTIRFAVALFVGLFVFATAAQVAIGQIRRATVDLRLETTTRALISMVAAHAGRLVVEDPAGETFSRVIAPVLNGAIIQRGGIVLRTTAVMVPTAILGFADRPPAATTLSTLAARGPYREQLRIAVTPVPTRAHPLGVAVVWRSEPNWMDIDSRLAITIAGAIPLVLVFAFVAGARAAERGLAPLAAVARLASEIEATDLSRRLGSSVAAAPGDELYALAETFDRMLDRLESAFARERRFTADASHELRAPLSVIRAEADLMLRRPREPAEYERALAEIAIQADRLERMTRDLLAAARATVPNGRRSDESPAVSDLVATAFSHVGPAAEARAVQLTAHGDAGTPIAGRMSDLSRALVCAVHNAVKFSPEGGLVTVHWTHAAGHVTVSIDDDGPGFSADALLHALERFWHDSGAARAARGGASAAGSGLGLAIAHEIVTGYGGTLTVGNRPTGGGHVCMTFPRAHRASPTALPPATGYVRA